jgi:hypothetical protein
MALVSLVVEEPTDFIQIAGIRQIWDTYHGLTSSV